MALIICPECKNQISDAAVSCPHCGYSSSHTAKVEEQIKKTAIGEFKKNTTKGVVMIVTGMISLIIGILGAIIVVGWPFIILGFFLLVLGTSAVKGGHTVTCPYCGVVGHILPTAVNYKCKACKKVGVREGNNLKTV